MARIQKIKSIEYLTVTDRAVLLTVGEDDIIDLEYHKNKDFIVVWCKDRFIELYGRPVRICYDLVKM